MVKITDFGLARKMEDKPYYRMRMVNGQTIALPLMWWVCSWLQCTHPLTA